MRQLDLFEGSNYNFENISVNGYIPGDAVRYLTPEECVQRGYVMAQSDALNVTIPVDANGVVTTGNPFRIKNSVEQQWNITYTNNFIRSEEC